MTIDNCVIDMDWRGITIHVAYVIRKEKNKYLLDVISLHIKTRIQKSAVYILPIVHKASKIQISMKRFR
jgi:hypothetical protein